MTNSRSVWAQSSISTKIAAGATVLAGFAIVLFIRYARKTPALLRMGIQGRSFWWRDGGTVTQ